MSDSDKLAYACGGIVVAGLLYLVLALLFKLVGAQEGHAVLPPHRHRPHHHPASV